MAWGMDWFGTLLEQMHELRCPTCGTRLERGTIRSVASESDRVVIQISCDACGLNSVAILERIEDVGGLPITPDDVLDAHEILAHHDGGLAALFAKAA